MIFSLKTICTIRNYKPSISLSDFSLQTTLLQTSCPTPARSLGWRSWASGRPTSWRKVLSPPKSSPSTTRSWRLWTPSPTWAPPCQARLRSMLRSAAGSPKQLLLWPNSTSECGAMTCWEKGPRCASNKLVSCRLSFMAASRGRPMPDKSGDSTDSTSAAFGACCTTGGKTELPTQRAWSALAHWACHHCSFSDAFDGSAMHISWSLTACQEKSFMENCGRASVAWVDRCCATRTSETCDLDLSTPVHGRTSPNTEIHGGKVSKRGFQRRKRTLESRLHARERRGKNAQPLRAFPQGTSAPPATETATPGSGYTVIQDPAQFPSANCRLFETRMPLLDKTA